MFVCCVAISAALAAIPQPTFRTQKERDYAIAAGLVVSCGLGSFLDFNLIRICWSRRKAASRLHHALKGVLVTMQSIHAA